MVKTTEELRAEHLLNMDKVIRYLNDEEYMLWWLEEGVPDGSTKQDLIAYVQNDPQMYFDCCRIFARIMSEAILHSPWCKDGYTQALFNPEKVRKEAHSGDKTNH